MVYPRNTTFLILAWLQFFDRTMKSKTTFIGFIRESSYMSFQRSYTVYTRQGRISWRKFLVSRTSKAFCYSILCIAYAL